MQTNTRKPHSVQPRPSAVSAVGPSKQVCKVPTRRVPYRVGYSWNKGGRLKELRIRHLARKFLKIWIHRTFGRVLPHKAKSHYNSVVLRRAFVGWKDEWWTSRREWSLIMRAECHYRYYLYNLVFHHWRIFVSLQRTKKSKLQNAQLFADRQRMCLVLHRWEVYTGMKRIKKKMLESALELNRLTTQHSVWRLWQVRLQHHQDFYALEDQALKQRELTIQRRAWLQWKEMHTTSLCLKEKESKAALHFILSLKRKSLYRWKCYISIIQTKKESQAVTRRARRLRLLMTSWSKWKSALHLKKSEEDWLQAAGRLALQITQRRALKRWRAYVVQCREKAEKDRIACQHHKLYLLRAGFQGLVLNVIRNKTHRLNNNMAVQQYHQTLTIKYWKQWQDRLEEAEDKSYQPLTEMALTKHSTSLVSSCFQHWRAKLTDQRHMQELEHCADIWFAERMLPRCFNSWVKFTRQRRLDKQRRRKAEVFNQQRQYTWVFYSWWGRSEQHKEHMLSERMAILHEERSLLLTAWRYWRQRTEQQLIEEEKQEASEHLYKHRLLHKTMTEWKVNSTAIRDRRNLEQQACLQGDLRCMRWAVEKWKKFVHSQRVRKSRLQQMQGHHEGKLLEHTYVAWKKRTLQMSQLCGHAEELYHQQNENFCRKVLCVWRENAVLMAKVRLVEQRAQNHFEHLLQLKVFLAWRKATTRAVSKRLQQREAVSQAQRSLNEVRLLRSLRQWRKQTRAARRERICMEKARRHHESKLLSKAMKAWNKHHCQWRQNKVMKQGVLLLRLKMYQTYFEQWRVKLRHRHREAQQTERALWHWSLSLQAKMLCGWRLWVTEQRREQEQVATAAKVYRDQLLREGVTRILTYASHMNDLTTSLMQPCQDHRSKHLQRVVKRCALRWKQRALSKSQRGQEVKDQLPKKSVTFCLPGPKSISPTDSVEQEAEEGELRNLLLSRTHRRQPRRCEDLFTSPVKTNLRQTKMFFYPPSAFMTTGTDNTFGKTNRADVVPTFYKLSSAFPAVSGESLEDASKDSTAALTRELLSIQLDMKTYQQDRKQLRAWQKLREVLRSWLQTSGKDEQMEKTAVCEELKELEERIHSLSTDLGKRKPTMLLHAQRIQNLQTVLQASGVSLLYQKAEDVLCLQYDGE
ncbi:LOW QUALITY PROTEIN: protein SFI1 homolog [Tautogolabrus adspersus]